MSTCQQLFGIHLMTIGKRLKEERLRLSMNQVDFGAVGGIKKQAQINYESDQRSPNGDYFSKIGLIGVDVAYVITGVRSMPVNTQQSEPLSREESVLLDNFRHSSPKAQAAIKATSDALAQRDLGKNKTG